MIDTWLDRFHTAWKNHDIDTVLSLFTDDAEYWETPHLVLHGKDAVRKEWQAILDQQNINVVWEIFNSSPDNHHSVRWSLTYTKDGTGHKSAGIYLIQLDKVGLCSYFYYVGEDEK